MKTKVLIVSSWFPSPASSLNGIFVKDQAEVLTKDYDVAVIAPWYGGIRYALEKKGPHLTLEPVQNVTAMKQSRVWPIPRFHLYNHLAFYRALKKDFKELLKEWGKPDLIHAHVVLPAGWAAVKLGKEFQIPVVITEHSCPFSMHLNSGWKRNFVRWALKEAARVTAVSPSLANEIQQFYQKENYEVVPNLVRDQLFSTDTSFRRPSEQFSFLSVATLEPRKGLKNLIEAVSLLRKKGLSNFNLTLCGSGPQEKELKDLTRKLELGSTVSFLKSQPRAKISELMQKCDAFVLPSYHETFGLVLAEAMACGKPVIATKSGGAEYVVTAECGLLVNQSTPKLLTEALEKFMSGNLQFTPSVIRENAVRRFGEAQFLERIRKGYAELLEH